MQYSAQPSGVKSPQSRNHMIALAITALLAACGGGSGADTPEKSTAQIAPSSGAAASNSKANSVAEASSAASASVSEASASGTSDANGNATSSILAARTESSVTSAAAQPSISSSSASAAKTEQKTSSATNPNLAAAIKPSTPDNSANKPSNTALSPVAPPSSFALPNPAINDGQNSANSASTKPESTNAADVANLVANPAPAITGQRSTPSAKPVNNSDIFAQIDTRNTFKSYGWLWSVECAGVAKGAIDVPESGIQGSDLGAGLGTMRFGKVPDPDAPQRKVLQFRANKDDGLQAGAPRCELSFSATQPGRLEIGREFWFAFGIRLDKWINTPEEQIVAQIHQSDGSIPLNPIFALSVLGDKFSLYYRNNANSVVTKASTTSIDGWSSKGLPTKEWTYFVVKATVSTNPKDSPHLFVWKDGQQIVNYVGAFGYNTPSVTPFAKFGHYQWGGPGNAWSASAPTKTVLIRNPTFVRASSTANYQESDIRVHVMNN